MGQTMVEKILAKSSNKVSVHPGEIIEAKINVAMAHDQTAVPAIQSFHEIGKKKVWDPERIIIFLDHAIPAPSEKFAVLHKIIREFAREQRIRVVENKGICHQVMVEDGWVYPGAVVVGADSHTCTQGALGCFATGVGSTEIASIFATGNLWFKVPETIKIDINGQFNVGVSAKDLILFLCGELTAEGASYKSIEFTGPAVEKMGVSQRMTLCNMTIEMGAKSGLMEPNDAVIHYLKNRTGQSWDLVKADIDAHYSQTINVDLSVLEPLAACPSNVDKITPVQQLEGLEIDQAFLGTCTNGRLEDLHIAAQVLKGRKVHQRVRFIVIPSSAEVYIDALKDGTLDILAEAGAIICNPGCGPCCGGHQGLMAPGECCISTSNRNFQGRMGTDADIYLASPLSVTVAALFGRIKDPRDVI